MIGVASKIYAKITGVNPSWAPVTLIQDQLNEKRPLPVGITEFHEWSDRIISGAGLQATVESQKYTLANLILHMKPTEAYCEDLYFINSLRKYASNQVADFYRQKIFPEVKERLRKEEEAKQNLAESTPPVVDNVRVLENKTV